MRSLYVVICSLLLTMSLHLSAQGTLHFTRYSAIEHNIGYLEWNKIADDATYHLYRRYPQAEGFSTVATIGDTHWFDTVSRVICHDTVAYYLVATHDTNSWQSDTIGILFQDDIPTNPCTLRLCSVDTLSQRIQLSWYPSRDTDIVGYRICMGSPCLDYDTVWGRNNCLYLCDSSEKGTEMHMFRVLAFDSCGQASVLTPYYHNPVLQASIDSCGTTLSCRWNRYINMPDSVGHYRLYYRLTDINGTAGPLQCHNVGPAGPFAFDTTLDVLTVKQVQCYLSVDNTSDSLHAFSTLNNLSIAQGDTARYLQIADIQYDETVPAINLRLEVDSLFDGTVLYLYRHTNDDTTWQSIATITLTHQRYLTFTDVDINPFDSSYCYRIGIPDICQHWIKYSDSRCILLPDYQEPQLWIPNTLIYGDPINGTLCPLFLSPVSRDYHFAIFDRQGLRLFETNDLHQCWDPSASPQPLQTGTYVYHIRCRHIDGSLRHYTGTVTLLK